MEDGRPEEKVELCLDDRDHPAPLSLPLLSRAKSTLPKAPSPRLVGSSSRSFLSISHSLSSMNSNSVSCGRTSQSAHQMGQVDKCYVGSVQHQMSLTISSFSPGTA